MINSKTVISHTPSSIDKAHLFFHAAACNEHWSDLVNEQLRYWFALPVSKVTALHLCIAGADDKELEDFDYILEHENADLGKFEMSTLACLWRFARSNPNSIIGYAHSKGVSHIKDGIRDQGSEDWREWMQWIAWERYEEHFLRLFQSYDASGADLRRNCRWFPYYYYTGNFWWSKSTYIRRLDDPAKYEHDLYKNRSMLKLHHVRFHYRFNAEFWIGTRFGRFFNLGYAPRKPFRKPFPREAYTSSKHPLAIES